MSKIILNGIEYSNGITYEELQPVIYSTEEREIGVWTDGKPLYQRTITYETPFNITNGSWYESSAIYPDMNIVNSDIVNSVFAHYTGAIVTIENSKLVIGNQTKNQPMNNIKYVTIQYTKTTDTAGSGNWNTDGVPTHHYSTNEQVIGTWIDGKPRYEITLSGSGSYSAGSELVVPLPTNADKVVIMGGYVDIGTDWLPVNLTLGVGTGTTNGVYCYPNKSTGVHIYSSAWTFSEYNVTVQYCKTTD